MEIKIYQVDAFAEGVFKGNPAAVCPLKEVISDELMQSIAMENNLSETAYIFDKDGERNIRWFTPGCEVDLCGHATLASAHVLFNHEGFEGDTIEFMSKSGKLYVTKRGDDLELDFPEEIVEPCEHVQKIENGLGKKPLELYKGTDYFAVFESESDVEGFKPDFRTLAGLDSRGLIVTAKGKDVDFVSRWFGSESTGVDEDPVTGSAHCSLTPYWAKKLGKTELNARQLSARGGSLKCTQDGSRIRIAGKAVTYMTGTITI